MKIRTITIGLPGSPTPELIMWAGKQLLRATDYFNSKGYQVQSRRIALEHWNVGLGLMAESQRTELLYMVDSTCADSGIDFCSVGMISEPSHIEYIAPILVQARRLNASADGGDIERGMDRVAISAAAKAILHMGAKTDEGVGNFRFAVGFCLGPGIPFFPGSYHVDSVPSFTIGFENSDLLVKAFATTSNLEAARQRLYDLLQAEYSAVENSASGLSELIGLPFGGLDTSIVPSLVPEESVVQAFRALKVPFGDWGTIAICSAVTEVVKKLAVKKIGYCGIMLPILEDVGLAQTVDKGRLRIVDLLMYSCVCGVGVDMVPVAGNTCQHQLEAIMIDVGTIAIRLKKPLSVRLLPIPGKRVGESTQFSSEYLCNSRIMEI